MDLEHSFTIPVPPEQAWQILLDVEQVAPCMPGATVDKVDGDVISGKVKVKVGPVSLTYAGSARFTEKDEKTRTVVLDASGKETRGSGTAAAKVTSSLQDEGGQTRVVVHTSMTVTGRPAQFGRGVIAEVGGRIIKKFATNLAGQLASGQAAPPAAGSGAAASGAGRVAAAEGNGGGAASGAPADAAKQPIEELNLPVRSYNSLRREGVHTVGGLTARTEKDLLAIDGLGPQSVKEIRQRLADWGLNLSSLRRSQRTCCRSSREHPGHPGHEHRHQHGQPGHRGIRPGRRRCRRRRGPGRLERTAATARRAAAGRGCPRPAERGRPAGAQARAAGLRIRLFRGAGLRPVAPPPPGRPRLTRQVPRGRHAPRARHAPESAMPQNPATPHNPATPRVIMPTAATRPGAVRTRRQGVPRGSSAVAAGRRSTGHALGWAG